MSDTVEVILQASDTVEITVPASDTVEISIIENLTIATPMEIITTLSTDNEGYNVIAHTLGRKVSFLTAFHNQIQFFPDWSPYDIDDNLSTTNVYIYGNPQEYIDAVINIF